MKEKKKQKQNTKHKKKRKCIRMIGQWTNTGYLISNKKFKKLNFLVVQLMKHYQNVHAYISLELLVEHVLTHYTSRYKFR